MVSTESQTQNQSQQSTMYDGRVFNKRIRELFNSIDSTSISTTNNQMTSIVDNLFPEQTSSYQQHDQHTSSTNDIVTNFERFSLLKSNNISSASAFCGGTTNGSSVFTSRHHSTLHSSSHSSRNTHHHHYQPPVARSVMRLSSAAKMITSKNNNTNGPQRSSLSLSINNSSTMTDYQTRFANCLSTTRLPPNAPAGSHDQIADIMSQSSPASAVISRNTSVTSAQSQQPVTMTQTTTTTTTFYYVPASDSLVYNNLLGTNRNINVSHD